MAETTNRFDLSETLAELKDFVRARAGAVAGQTQHKPTPEQIQTAVLSALVGSPKNAAQVVATMSLASAGGTSLSSAQVHPVLARLVEAKLVTAKNKNDRKVFSITELGREFLDDASAKVSENQAAEDSANAGSKTGWGSTKDWLQFDPNFMKAAAKLAAAVSDVAKTGTRAQQEKATKVLEEARRQLHVILAEG